MRVQCKAHGPPEVPESYRMLEREREAKIAKLKRNVNGGAWCGHSPGTHHAHSIDAQSRGSLTGAPTERIDRTRGVPGRRCSSR